ncbi:glycosyltransferase family 2 protein [Gemmatirosa kalamazoonensis]|uniref:glycosyltransferase family 2 protein n=1 Tax=Gemmatirosa kalamazoonensis TaxID=861299 RepID=UPI00191C25FF|nr:glycosyltransferase [Gemmatirosa kalamazoonensis]
MSVVIPTFRREGMVVEAVRSALGQTGVALEVIVLDDSPEASAKAAIAAIGDARVRYVHRAVPSGGNPALVRNEGLSLARGEFLHFLDDDDVFLDGALAASIAALRRTNAGVAVGLVKPFGPDPAAVREETQYFADGEQWLRRAKSRFALVAGMLYRRTPLVNSACTIRRTCAEAVGGYSAAVRIVEDVDFYLRAIRRFGFVFLDRTVVKYRVGLPSIMHSLTDRGVLKGSYRQIYLQYRNEHGPVELLALRAYDLVRRLGGVSFSHAATQVASWGLGCAIAFG